MNTLYSTNNYGLYNVALLYNTAWCCIFNGSNDNITDICISSCRSTHNTDAKELLCSAVISNL